jgi:hypothetical protein
MKTNTGFNQSGLRNWSGRLSVSLGNRAQRVGTGFLNWFKDNPEPRIRVHRDRHGTKVWEVYNPQTRQRVTLLSEDAVRDWLDRGCGSPELLEEFLSAIGKSSAGLADSSLRLFLRKN